MSTLNFKKVDMIVEGQMSILYGIAIDYDANNDFTVDVTGENASGIKTLISSGSCPKTKKHILLKTNSMIPVSNVKVKINNSENLNQIYSIKAISNNSVIVI